MLNLTAATSTELLETPNGDRVESRALEEARLDSYWRARFFVMQWNFSQNRRGLGSPDAGEARMALRLLSYFKDFRSVEGWWEGVRHTLYSPEFVEWVEEQRAKATPAAG